MIKSISELNPGESENKTEWFESEFEKSFINLSEKPKRPEGLISIGLNTYAGSTYPNYIFTKGELSVITAPSKSFKSTFKSHLASVFVTGESKEFSDIVGHRQKGETIADIDTEQSTFFAFHTFNRTKRVSENVELSEVYYPFKIRQMTSEQRLDFIELILKTNKIPNLALMFVDGIADLLNDTNDLAESNRVINKIMQLTDEYNIHICLIIHTVYGSSKATGHTGSAVMKKAETVMNIQEVMDDKQLGMGYYRVRHTYSRGGKFDDFYFKNNANLGRLIQVDENGIELNQSFL